MILFDLLPKCFYLSGTLRAFCVVLDFCQPLFYNIFLRQKIRPDWCPGSILEENKLWRDTEKKRNRYQTVPLYYFYFWVFRAFLKKNSLIGTLYYLSQQKKILSLSFMLAFVCYSQLLPSFGPSICKNSSSASAWHSGFKTMLIASLSSRRLKCSFHYLTILVSCKWPAKV